MKKTDRSQWSLNTKLNHPKRIMPREDNPSTVAPIYQSVKFSVSPDVNYHDQFIYTRISNPTLQQLEILLAEIQKREECIVFGSGIAAITNALLGVLEAGDHMISFRELYKPARVFIKETLPRFGISSTLLKLSEIDRLEQAIIPGKTKLIHFESPSNPNLEIADVQKIIDVARKHKVLVSMDGTFGGLHQHTQFDIDIVIQSLTKYANGHGDVLAGSVSGKASALKRIKHMSIALGATLDPHAAYLIERGLKTYKLRYERQTQNAQIIAKFLATHPKVKRVYYPGLIEHRGHDLAKKQMSDMGAMLAFEIEPSVGTADEFCHRLNLIQFAVSLGSTETLIASTHFFFGDDLSSEDKKEMGINLHSLRLSVGIEEPEDVILDLKSVLE